MKRGIILYKSKYGATKKYVDWLVTELSFEYIETSKAKIDTVKQYDTIILCGGIYASGIAGLSFIKKYYSLLVNKKIVILCVGASPFNNEAFAQIKEHNLKDQLKGLPMYYARGAWDEENMTFLHRNLSKILYKVIAKKDPNTYEPWEKALIEAKGQKVDWTDKSYLTELLLYINE